MRAWSIGGWQLLLVVVALIVLVRAVARRLGAGGRCRHCGEQVGRRPARFCPRCGQPLN